MGASFPFFCRGLVGRQGRGFLGWLSAAYGVNVLGAAVGCYLTATVLLMELGIWKSVLLAGGMNLLAAGLAWGIHRGSRESETTTAPPSEPAPLLLPAPVLYALIAASGFSAMAFEVIWSRMVRQALWLANPFQAFAQVLSLILLGMAIGSILLALRRLDRARALRFFGRIQLVIAGVCILGITQLRWDLATLLAGDLVRLYQWISMGSLGVGALMLGMGFPLLAATHAQAAEKIGGLYAASAVGGVLGTLAGGFVLIPFLGTRGGLLVLAVGFAFTGGLALLAPRWSASTRKPLWLARLVAAPVVLALGVGAWTEDRLDFECQGCTLLWLNDGLEATTAVALPPDGNTTLYTNGKSITPGALPQRALTPFLVAPVADRVLSIGFGSGQLALMVAENFPDTQLDCVELDGNMAQTTEFFGTTALLSLPNFKLFIDDGRQHMLRSPRTYDVILADTFTHSINTQIYGSGFFQVAREALTEQGSFFITVPLQDLPSDTEAEIILRTAAQSFPHAYVLAPNGMVGIIGRTQPLDVESALHALPQTLQGELSFELTPTDIYEIDDQVLAQFGSDRINSDDQPYFFPLMQKAEAGTAEQMHDRIRGWGQLSAETTHRHRAGPRP
jgi:spermidine synthase